MKPGFRLARQKKASQESDDPKKHDTGIGKERKKKQQTTAVPGGAGK